jgi:phosphinothricin acetyltransferase
MYATRIAHTQDADAICAIYNQGISDRIATFETKLRGSDDMRASLTSTTHPWVVACHDDTVVAFAGTSLYRARECYAGIAEFSVYVERDWRGRGAGSAVMRALCTAATTQGFWKLVSRVFVENTASRALLATIGFREVGIYERHAQLDGVWRDVVIVEKLLC